MIKKYLYELALLMMLTPSLTIASTTNSDKKNFGSRIIHSEETMSLTELLDATTKHTGKRFKIHSKAKSKVFAYGIDRSKVTLNELFLVLEHNQLAAYERNNYINILPINKISRENILTITGNETVDNPNLWVTRIIDTGSHSPGHYIPTLRALIKQSAHMAPFTVANAIIIIAPYHSVMRLEEVINQLKDKKRPLGQNM